MKTPIQVFLTFDVEGPMQKEDCFSKDSIRTLLRVLKLLKNHQLKGIFFILGTIIEDLVSSGEILDKLGEHTIGYHSSSHSIRPRIFEYTDVMSYEKAVKISIKRETSNINPENGAIKGTGGLQRLREIFPHHKIECFRAPFLCWSPPHLEALSKLGILFDFSTNINEEPIQFHNMTFYPFPIAVDGIIQKIASAVDGSRRIFPRLLISRLLSRKRTVLLIHPTKIAFKETPYNRKIINGSTGLPFQLTKNSVLEIEVNFLALDIFLRMLKFLEQAKLIEVTSRIQRSRMDLDRRAISAENLYFRNAKICKKLFDYSPQYMYNHFQKFLENSTST